jgi:CheY-like chemotaxis protein
VVDDHPFSVGLIKDVLIAAGAAAVMTAADGERALRLLNVFNPDVVLTDWKMPGMDGLTFTQTIRQAGRTPDARVANPRIPIVLLSGHTSVGAVRQARLAGVDEVTAKPFSTTALIERLVAALTNPRAFVVAEAYIGPDRRRRKEDDAPKRRRRGDQAAGADLGEADSRVEETVATAESKTSVLKRLRRGVDMLAAEDVRSAELGQV